MSIETFEDNFFELEVEPEWTDKVRGFALGSWVQGGASGVDNVPIKDLAKRTEYLKKEVDTIISLSPGSLLDANDFGTEDPSQEALTDYALLKIGETNPLKIWSGTKVKNLFDGNMWILVNTPDTEPAIFEWINNGPDEVVVDVSGNVFKAAPFIVPSGKRKLVVKSGTKIILGTRRFHADEDIELDIEALLDTGVLQNAKDYYIFLCPGTELGSVIISISLTKTNPQGFNPADVLLIGGFHTLCTNVGSSLTYVEGGVTKNHLLNGYVSGDILPYSVWCLNHRPHSEPEGMVYIPSLDFWCDIYLQSGNGPNTKSVYQGAITRSREYVDHVEDMFCVRKELLDDGEFAAAMLGSNEQTAVAGASEAGATTNGAGGRLDTAGRRMISIYGVEEGCGSIWQWLRTTSAGGGVGGMYGRTADTPTYGWITMTQSSYGPYGQAGGKGSFWGLAGALLAGGYWNDSTGCGSRARSANHARARAAALGGRGRSRTIR
jgi:hypothetical protein